MKNLHSKQKLVVSTEYISENPSHTSSDFVPADKPNWFWANQSSVMNLESEGHGYRCVLGFTGVPNIVFYSNSYQ